MSSGKTLPQVHIITLSLPLHKSPPLAEMEPSDLSKFLPTRAYFRHKPFLIYCIFKPQKL